MKETLINEINQLLQEITEVTDALYQQKLNEGYTGLNSVIGHIMKLLEQLFAYKEANSFYIDENQIINSLTAAMKAMEEKDSVLLADIMSLELAEQFSEIVGAI